MKILVMDEDVWEAFSMLLFRANRAMADGDVACARRCLAAIHRLLDKG